MDDEHTIRFGKVASEYPRVVAEAYGGDIAAAARDTDEQVSVRVREWEVRQGLEPQDWIAIGRSEGRDEHRWIDELLERKTDGHAT
jgi:hypothetical protein